MEEEEEEEEDKKKDEGIESVCGLGRVHIRQGWMDVI